MVKAVGAPPDKIHDNVADSPEIIVVLSVVKVEITGATGGAGFTVIVETLLVMLPLEAVMLAEPAVIGVTKPAEFTEATAVLFEAQVRVAVIGFEYWSRVVAVICCVAPPAVSVAVVGESVIVVKTGGGGLTVTVTDFVAMPLTFEAVKV